MGTRYYFIPPTSWDPRTVSEDQWRKGEAFEMARAREKGTRRKPEPSKRKGYVDYEGHVWVWDSMKRHWDVQFGGHNEHLPVTHNGDYREARLAHLLR
jgi:hypothetical protein